MRKEASRYIPQFLGALCVAKRVGVGRETKPPPLPLSQFLPISSLAPSPNGEDLPLPSLQPSPTPPSKLTTHSPTFPHSSFSRFPFPCLPHLSGAVFPCEKYIQSSSFPFSLKELTSTMYVVNG